MKHLRRNLADEIRRAIGNPNVNGYYISLRMYFLGRVLRHGDANFWKLASIPPGQGRYECRLRDQDVSMADMEVHEHVVVDGPTSRLTNPLIHHNVESLSRYIQKHDEYSNWESRVLLRGEQNGASCRPALFGTSGPAAAVAEEEALCSSRAPRCLLFFYRYFLRGGLLDGIPGLIYCVFQAVQMFHTKAKIYELKSKATGERA